KRTSSPGAIGQDVNVVAAIERSASGDEVLLMSDGFSAAIADYAHHTAETLVDTIKRDGLHRVVAQIRDIEDRDAECATFPRFKKSDDCTALWLRVSA
ncbi:MAG: hypothetical protein AAFO58_06180, partial [Pseudomonadota bacterium]